MMLANIHAEEKKNKNKQTASPEQLDFSIHQNLVALAEREPRQTAGATK